MLLALVYSTRFLVSFSHLREAVTLGLVHNHNCALFSNDFLNTTSPVLSHCAMNDTQQQVETNEKRCRRAIDGPENHVPYEIEPVVGCLSFSSIYEDIRATSNFATPFL